MRVGAGGGGGTSRPGYGGGSVYVLSPVSCMFFYEHLKSSAVTLFLVLDSFRPLFPTSCLLPLTSQGALNGSSGGGSGYMYGGGRVVVLM